MFPSLTTGYVASCVTSRCSWRCSVLWRVARLCYICKCFRCLLMSPTSLLTFSLTPRGFVAFILISSLCVAAAFVFGTVVFFATITGLCIYSSIPLVLIPSPFAGTALFFTLFITLFISVFISVSLIGVFLFLRFILHLRSQPTLGDGVQCWAQETKGRFLSSVQISKESSHGSDGYEKITTQ